MDGEFASDAPTSSAVDNRPLADRLVDKNWKTRVTAYEDLKKEIKVALGEDPVFNEYDQYLSKITADSNAGALDAGLDTALLFVEMAPLSIIRRIAHSVCTNVVDKALSATKASTVTKGKALIVKLIEVDDPSTCTPILLTKLSDKKPKIPPGCLEILKESLAAFGARPFPIKEIIPTVGAVLGGANGTARELAMTLLVDLCRWIGKPPFNALLESIKPVQKQEFEKLLADKESEPAPTPTIWLRKDRPKPGDEAKATKIAAAPTIDPREFVEETDLVKKLKGTEYATLIAEEKWSEQLKALQLVIDALGPNPKIKPGCDVSDTVTTCKGFIKQGHVQLQVSSLKILTLLADGMRAEFSTFVRPLISEIILKTKEKRLIPEAQACLINILKYSIPLESMVENISENIKNKKNPPHARVALNDFLNTAFTEITEKAATDTFKPLADALISICEDSDPKVRDSAAVTLGSLATLVRSRGRPAVEAHKTLMGLENSLPKVFKKVQAAMEASAGSAPPAAATSDVPMAAKKKPTVPATSDSTEDENGSSNGPGTRPLAKRTPALAVVTEDDGEEAYDLSNHHKSPAIASAKPKVGGLAGTKKSVPLKSTSISSVPKKTASGAPTATTAKKNDASDDVEEDLAMTTEDAEVMLAALLGPGWDTIKTQLESAKWQDKVEALGKIGEVIKERTAGGEYSGAVVIYLKAKTTGFKISNINILKAVISCANDVASATGATKFSKPAAWELIKALGDKFSDKKMAELVSSLLTGLAEAVGPGFVVKRMKSVLDKTKAPVAHENYLQWLKGAVAEFGCGAFPVPFLGTFCQLEMDNKVAGVRTAAVEVMGALYYQLGPRLLSVAVSDDMKPALKTLLDAEFTKVGFDPSKSVKPLRAVKGEEGASSDGGGIPRTDLSVVVDKTIQAEMNLTDGKNSWQNRKAAMEAVIAACERSGHYMDGGKQGPEIIKSLKARMNDTQANNKPIAAAAIGHVIASLEIDQAAKLLRLVSTGLLSGMGDNKKQMRDCVVAALQMAVTQAKEGAAGEPALLAVLMGPIGESLVNVVGRQELMQWVLPHIEVLKLPDKGDYGELAVPLVACLQDKTAAVRTLAEQLTTALLARALMPKKALEKATQELQPATKRGLQPAIDRMIAAFGTRKAQPHKVNISTTSMLSPVEEAPSPMLSQAELAYVEEVPPPPPMLKKSITQPTYSTDKLLPSSSTTTTRPDVRESKDTIRASTSAFQSKLQATQSAVVAALTNVVKDTNPILETGGQRYFLKKCNKSKRLEEFLRVGVWPQPPEDIGESEFIAVRQQWEPLMTSELFSIAFAPMKPGHTLNQDVFVAALTELMQQLEGPYALLHTDLIFRYTSYCLCQREASTGLQMILQLMIAILEKMHHENIQLHETEVNILLPHVIDRSGHKSERHATLFRSVITTAGEVVAPNRMCAVLLQGLSSKNKKSRLICIEEITKIVDGAGNAPLGKNGLREIGAFLESKENDSAGKGATLELIYSIYVAMGSDMQKTVKALGAEKSATLIDERVKRKAKGGSIPKPSITHKTTSGAGLGTAIQPPPSYDPPVEPSKILRGGSKNGSFSPPRETIARETVAAIPTNVSPVRAHPPQMAATPSPFRMEEYVPQRRALGAEPPVRDLSYRRTTSEDASESMQTYNRMNSMDRGELASQMIRVGSSKDLNFERKMNAFAEEAKKSEYLLEGLYLDVVHKIDALLSCREAVPEESQMQEDAKDYLKMLHSIVTGEWTAEKHEDDDELLRRQVIPLMHRVLKCVERAFVLPAIPAGDSPLSVDVGLASVSLATLFSLVRRQDIIDILPEMCLSELLAECLTRIVDSRLTNSGLDKDSSEVAQQMVRALNLILIKAGTGSPTGTSLSALLHVLYSCIQDLGPEHKPLPPLCAKPASRLLVKVMNDEVKKSDPFTLPSVNLKKLLLEIHQFFAKHPTNTTNGDDTPFCAAKTLLSQIVNVRGGQDILNVFMAVEVPPSSFAFRLAARLANIALPDISNNPSSSGLTGVPFNSLSSASGDLNDKVVSLIDEITSSRDKQNPIRELHALLKKHPEINVNQYLQRISAAFRRFVLDTLSKLDTEADGGGISISKSSSIDGADAMKIIEGLKNKNRTSSFRTASVDGPALSSYDPQSDVIQRRSSTSIDRTAINDVVRGKLLNLSTALDLPTAPISEDFVARFSRLKSMVEDK